MKFLQRSLSLQYCLGLSPADRLYHATPENGTTIEGGVGGLPLVRTFGLNTRQASNLAGMQIDTSGNITAPGNIINTTPNQVTNSPIESHTPTPANVTVTLTAAQVLTGYIKSTSAAAVTLTLPTGTLLGAALGAVQGTIFKLYIDNTAGANTVTIAVATNGILSDAAATTAASFGQLTVASGATGLAEFTLMFSSATAYAFTRTA